MDDTELIELSFRPLIRLPCWRANRWHGSMFRMHFGDPHLVVREPTARLRTRLVVPEGEWHLSIELCGWRIFREAQQLAHSESSQNEMDRAVAYLDGQSLTDVPSLHDEGYWQFSFDLGGTLTILPYEDFQADEEQWLLYQPDEWIIVSDANGNVRRVHKDSRV